MPEDTPVLDTLALMTAASVDACDLEDRELMLARIAALAAVGAPPVSYLLNAGTAVDAGVTLEDVRGVLIAVAPIVGTARVMSAATNLTRRPRLCDRGDGGRGGTRDRRRLNSCSCCKPLAGAGRRHPLLPRPVRVSGSRVFGVRRRQGPGRRRQDGSEPHDDHGPDTNAVGRAVVRLHRKKLRAQRPLECPS